LNPFSPCTDHNIQILADSFPDRLAVNTLGTLKINAVSIFTFYNMLNIKPLFADGGPVFPIKSLMPT